MKKMIREEKVTRAERILSGFCPVHAVALAFYDMGGDVVEARCLERHDGRECRFRVEINIVDVGPNPPTALAVRPLETM